LALLVIALATLLPASGTRHEWVFCLACGDRGAADVLLNVALFMPLGAALSLRGRSLSFVALLALLLSSVIELSQFSIPGRDPTFGDVVSNTLGAVLGALLVRRASSWLTPQPQVASWLCRGAAVVAALVCFATGLLLTPSFPRARYHGLWTPDLGHLERYRGRILDASLEAVHIEPGPIAARSHVRELLQSRAGYGLSVRALAGPPPQRLAPLFAIFDEEKREIVLVGADREDLVLRVRTRAADWRFDQPDLRLAAFEHVKSGDTLHVRVLARAGHYSINGIERGFTVGIGWALLMYPESLPFKGAVSALWICVLFVPAGFWLRTRVDGMTAALGVVAGLVLVPATTPLLRTPAAQWMAAGLGLLVGAALHVLLRPLSARRPRPA
jgi:hypothetical protein